MHERPQPPRKTKASRSLVSTDVVAIEVDEQVKCFFLKNGKREKFDLHAERIDTIRLYPHPTRFYIENPHWIAIGSFIQPEYLLSGLSQNTFIVKGGTPIEIGGFHILVMNTGERFDMNQTLYVDIFQPILNSHPAPS